MPANSEELINPADYVPPQQTLDRVEEIHSTIPPETVAKLHELGKNDLFGFAQGVLGFKDLNRKIHGPMCALLQDSRNRFLRFVLPRTWFKSTIVSVAFPIWCAIRNPDIRICIAQNTATNAIRKLKEIDDHFMKNAVFRALYPNMIPGKDQVWKTTEKEVPRPTPSPDPTFDGIGIKTAAVSRHYNLIIEDDTVSPDADEQTADNVVPVKEDIEKAIGFHAKLMPFFISPEHDRNIVVGTRWFEHDLLSHIQLKEPWFKSYERAMLEKDGLPDENGICAWPERYSPETLAQLRASVGPYMFSCLYQNQPMSSSEMLFNLEWFTYYDTEPLDLYITTTVDPAGDPATAKGRPDFCAIITTGKHLTTGKIYVLEAKRGRWNPGQTIDELIATVKLWHPMKVGIESVAYQRTLVYWTTERQRIEGFFRIAPLTHGRTSKLARIAGLQPVIADKKLLFRSHHTWLISELMACSQSEILGKNDDGADALSMHLPMWIRTQAVEEKERDYGPDPLSLQSMLREREEELLRWKQKANPIFNLGGVLPFTDPAFN